MKVTLLAGSCDNGTCPSLHKTDTGDFVFQGDKLPSEVRAALANMPAHEDAVLMPQAAARLVYEALRGEFG
jgi:hypothetical protein